MNYSRNVMSNSLRLIAPQLVVSDASDQLSLLSSSSSDLIMTDEHAQTRALTHPHNTCRTELDQISLG